MRTVAVIALVLAAFAAGVAITAKERAPAAPVPSLEEIYAGTTEPAPPPTLPPGALAISQDEVDRINAEQARLRQVELEARVGARAAADELRR